MKTLLARSVAEPGRVKQAALFDAGAVSDRSGNPDTAAFLAEVDSLKAQGLSWGEIARRWNSEGQRTERGAEFRGANIARDWRKWKGEQ